MAQDNSCQHRWMIETYPNAEGVCKGICNLCGSIQMFQNNWANIIGRTPFVQFGSYKRARASLAEYEPSFSDGTFPLLMNKTVDLRGL